MTTQPNCKHGTEPIYRCPVNAEHDEAADGLSDEPGFCAVDDCGEELEQV